MRQSLLRHGSYCQVLRRWLHRTSAEKQSNLTDLFKVAKESPVPKVQPEPLKIQQLFRTSESNPVLHSVKQEGLYYTVTSDVYERYVKPGQDPDYKKQVKTFNEACIMVRKPALEVFDILDNVNLSHPPTRIVLYGRHGSGKTMTMAHTIHRYGSQDWIVCQVPYVGFWLKWFKDFAVSTYNPERVDLPLMASAWLVQFRTQNAHLLKDVKLSHTYSWSAREAAEAGSPILDLIDFGTERVKFASDCFGAVLKELRTLASGNQCKVLVVVDGVNGFFRDTHIKADGKMVPASKLSLVHNFQKMLQPIWNNGVVLSTVDIASNPKEKREQDTPFYLLEKEGFAAMDPFVPIKVENYTDKEIHNCLDYYTERQWIQNPRGLTDAGRNELMFLSNKSPRELMLLCSRW